MSFPRPFGPYMLHARIAAGGMAEVFRAWHDKFGYFVALKKILPHIAEDDEFISMFEDEARIVSRLEHPHIARMLDFGRVDGSFYIAFEYVHGKDLRAVFERSLQVGAAVPLPFLLYVFSRIGEGLSYAHARRDENGLPVSIVHRDISPQNIIVSTNGDVKLIDFGIAKAQGKLSRTEAGAIKGNFGYMSPEQVRGKSVDAQTDVFSMGICLWEMLTQRRLFDGENELVILHKIRDPKVEAPSVWKPYIPPELDRVVLRALATDSSERYRSAKELYRDLHTVAMAKGALASRSEMAAYMRQLFPELTDGPPEGANQASQSGHEGPLQRIGWLGDAPFDEGHVSGNMSPRAHSLGTQKNESQKNESQESEKMSDGSDEKVKESVRPTTPRSLGVNAPPRPSARPPPPPLPPQANAQKGMGAIGKRTLLGVQATSVPGVTSSDLTPVAVPFSASTASAIPAARPYASAGAFAASTRFVPYAQPSAVEENLDLEEEDPEHDTDPTHRAPPPSMNAGPLRASPPPSPPVTAPPATQRGGFRTPPPPPPNAVAQSGPVSGYRAQQAGYLPSSSGAPTAVPVTSGYHVPGPSAPGLAPPPRRYGSSPPYPPSSNAYPGTASPSASHYPGTASPSASLPAPNFSQSNFPPRSRPTPLPAPVPASQRSSSLSSPPSQRSSSLSGTPSQRSSLPNAGTAPPTYGGAHAQQFRHGHMLPTGNRNEATAVVRPRPSRTGLFIGLAVALLFISLTAFVIVLFPRAGKVAVHVTDARGANHNRVEIFLDGKKHCETSPCLIEGVSAGSHNVKVIAEGGSVNERTIVTEARKQTPVDFILFAARGTGLRVAANQPSMRLFVDGRDLGPLPQDVKDLNPGDHKIRVVGSERYEPLERTVTLTKDEVQDLGTLSLKVLKGKVTITLGTPGAKVYLVSGTDRRDLPTFPISVDIDTSKGWTLEASRFGFSDYRQPITFADGQAEKAFNVQLEPKSPLPQFAAATPRPSPNAGATSHAPGGAAANAPSNKSSEAPAPAEKSATSGAADSQGEAFLTINSIPASSVVLDGKPIGSTPKVRVAVPPGNHTVVFVNAEQNLRKSVQVTVAAGDTKPVIGRLRE